MMGVTSKFVNYVSLGDIVGQDGPVSVKRWDGPVSCLADRIIPVLYLVQGH